MTYHVSSSQHNFYNIKNVSIKWNSVPLPIFLINFITKLKTYYGGCET